MRTQCQFKCGNIYNKIQHWIYGTQKKPIEHALIQWILVMLRSVFLGVGSLNIQQAPLKNTVNISIPSSNTRKALLINN